ncbi:MAG: diacylglycerol kinase family protein [Fuerstiella sp.]
MNDERTFVTRDFCSDSADRNLVVIQRNPTSGSGRGAKQIVILIRALRRLGYRVRLFGSRERLDQFVAHSAVQQQLRCLVAAGGDGTVSGLANRHSDFPIATLPLGTENLMARYLQIACCGESVAQLVHKLATACFDTAFADDQRFLLMTSVGVDADVVRRLHRVRTGNIRHLSYVKPILQSFCGYAFPRLSVHSPDGELLGEGTHVIVTNIPAYGFRMPFSPQADPQDGLLDVRIFRQAGRITTLIHALRTRLGFGDKRGDVQRFTASEIEIRSAADETPAQCDGDPAPCCPLNISVAPASMTMVVPETHPRSSATAG